MNLLSASSFRRPVASLLALAWLLPGSRPCVGQAMSGHDMGESREVPPPAQLPPPVHMTGIGNSHLQITATPEAQAWFDQGLNLFHDFWNYESERAFEQSVRTDPQCAMCFWGLYQSLDFRGGAEAYKHDAIANAERLKKRVSARERMYIDAAQADLRDNKKKEIKLYRKLVASDAADVQAKLFLANALSDGYTAAHEPKPGTAEAIVILEQVLKEHPDDSAANHYWIHAMEPSSHPERAIASAERLASEAPASGHMVHMPGHIFYRTGDYADAEKWFAQSMAVDEHYLHSTHVSVDDDWNYVHNMMYAIANLMEEGKLREATQLSGKLPGARGDFAATLYVGVPRDSISRLNPRLPVAMREGNWAAVVSLLSGVKPDAKLPNLNFLAGQLRDFALGMQAVGKGELATAEAKSNALADALAAKKAMAPPAEKKEKQAKRPATPVMQAVGPDATLSPLVTSLSILSLELRGSIFAARKDLPKAMDLFAQAAKAEADLGYREPPTFIRPVGEDEGVALLRAGDAADAHTAFAAALAERPNSGFSLYGMAQSSEAAGNAIEAEGEYERFLAAWKHADAQLPQLEHARAYVAKHGRSIASL